MAKGIESLIEELSRLAQNEGDKIRISRMIHGLDDHYELSIKIKNEPGVGDIILQLCGRLVTAYGDLSLVRGKKILDIACGSNTSSAPAEIYVNTPFGDRKIRSRAPMGYTAQFEPWFCRILLELGANPVGVDLGDLDREAFEHYRADLGRAGALDFLPSHSFDGIQDSRLFGSPEFTAQFPDSADRLRIAEEIVKQERRLLKVDGIIIHSDAGDLVDQQAVI